MIKLLEEIDELLTYLEDTAHGEEGKRITEMRYKILTELSNSHKHGVSGKQPYYQLCPKCAGEGQVHNIGTTSSLFRICPVCNGSRTLYVDPSMVACASGGEAQSQSEGFYCADWNRCGAICEEQCLRVRKQTVRNSCEGALCSLLTGITANGGGVVAVAI